MELKRYLVFAGISLAIHGVAFSANYKPITIAPIADKTGASVSIQLIQRSASEPTPQAVSEVTPESIPKTKPMVEPKAEPNTTLLSKLKSNPVAQPKATIKPIQKSELIEKEKNTKQITKQPAQPKAAETALVKNKSAQVKPNNKKPVQSRPVVKADVVSPVVAKKVVNPPVTSTPEEAIKPPQQARSSTPKMVKKPSFSAKPTPIEYPRSAKRRNIEGLVLVEIWIDEQGHQTKQMVIDSSGHPMLDQAAINAITKWQFKSYRDQGQLIAHRVQVPITFELN
ncbi:energy transducer TonB [Vibrio tapetis subsp. quintayensis]|uniref:energy transducer TonB n=1 Tax=Vibrio tapetis TaxID=52443 RepID=UPI0025B5F41F|nr:energy transducer TonB [Vibrio tapetis]MDN3680768.1 energy transducer TonB [Vibrio tapetis subsp. quintayensis]